MDRISLPGIATCLALLTTTLGQNGPSQEWTLRTEDKKAALYVQERGRGDVAVVLHGGFGSDSTYMQDVSRGLEDRHRFVFYDQRGSLRSPCKMEDVSFAKHLEDLESLRKELGVDKISIVAHSAGTLLACAYLQKYPEHVKGLALLGFAQPKWRFSDSDFPAGKPPVDWTAYGKAISDFNSRSQIHDEIAKQKLDKPKLTAKEQTDLWRIQYAGANTFHVERWREMQGLSHFYNPAAGAAAKDLFSTQYDFLPVLKAAKMPITIIEGTHDFCDFGGQLYKSLFANQPNVKVDVLNKAGHMMWIDDREGFRKALDDALSRKA